MAYVSLPFEIAHNHAVTMQNYAQRFSAYRASDPLECCKMVGDALLTRVNMLFRTVIGTLMSVVCAFIDISRIKERCSVDLHMNNEQIAQVELVYLKVIGSGFLHAVGGILLPELIGKEIVGTKDRIDRAIFTSLCSLLGDPQAISRTLGIDLNRLPDRGARLAPLEAFFNDLFNTLHGNLPTRYNDPGYNQGTSLTLRNFSPQIFREVYRTVLVRRYSEEAVQLATIAADAPRANDAPLPRAVEQPVMRPPVQLPRPPAPAPRIPVRHNFGLVDHAAVFNQEQVMATAIEGRIGLGQSDDTIIQAIVSAFPVTIEEARSAVFAVRAAREEAVIMPAVQQPRGDDQAVQQVIDAQLRDPQFGRVVTPALQEIHDAYLDAVRKACKELTTGEAAKYSVEDIAKVDPDAFYAVLQMAILIMCESAYVGDNDLTIPYVCFRKSGSGYSAQQKELHLSERYDSHHVYAALKDIHEKLHALEGKKVLLARLREKLTAKNSEPEQRAEDDKDVQKLFTLIGGLKTDAMERTVVTLEGNDRGPSMMQVLRTPQDWMNK